MTHELQKIEIPQKQQEIERLNKERKVTDVSRILKPKE